MNALKQSIDQQADKLLNEMNMVKVKRINKIKEHELEIDKKLVELRYFERFATEIRDKGSTAEICRIFAEFSSRSKELEKDHSVCVKSLSSLTDIEAISFNPSTCNDVLADNFALGEILTRGILFLNNWYVQNSYVIASQYFKCIKSFYYFEDIFHPFNF